jgi:FkbH-like protein
MRMVKCLVWDLDNTLWQGILLENDDVVPRPEAVRAIRTLDERGILNSVASRNDPDLGLAKLRELGLAEYFLCPQFGWGAKSESISTIAKRLNLGVDSLAFIDDDPFELAEVVFSLPEVRCLEASVLHELTERPEFSPEFVTSDAASRRLMYLADQTRQAAEEADSGPKEEFLAGLGMRFTIREAGVDDLRRVEELTARTNQLNTTGRTYSYEELDAFRRSDRNLLLTTELEDQFGPYGTIGLALVEQESPVWTVRLLLMSCRVASRGVGSVLMSHLKRRAAAAGVRLHADFRPTDRNRMMFVAYKFNRFTEIGRSGGDILLAADLVDIPPDPAYLTVLSDD